MKIIICVDWWLTLCRTVCFSFVRVIRELISLLDSTGVDDTTYLLMHSMLRPLCVVTQQNATFRCVEPRGGAYDPKIRTWGRFFVQIN